MTGILPFHLIIFVHGFYAPLSGLNYSSELLSKKLGQDALVYISTSNSAFFNGTGRGIDLAGNRLAEEIGNVITENPSLKEISFVGISLGGLISRYAIWRLLEVNERYELSIGGLKPVNYVTFATPHLGCRKGVSWVTENVLSYFGPIRLTTDQLFFRDVSEFGVPLLIAMSDPNSQFVKALGLFEHRIVYANIEGDHRVDYHSGAIWPYRLEGDYWKKPYHYEPDYEHIVTRPSWEKPETGMTWYYPSSEENVVAFNLFALQWTRYDVYFDGWFGSWLNHNNIFVSDPEVNGIGKSVVQHFVDKFPMK